MAEWAKPDAPPKKRFITYIETVLSGLSNILLRFNLKM